MNVKISGAVGAPPAPNKPEDVKKIQSLLNTVYGTRPVVVTGKSDAATIKAIGEYLKPEPPRRAYVALAPPHVDDLQADYAPCDPPSRIVLGIVGQAGTDREHLATCLEYCSDHDTPENMHRGLWGSLTHLVGITVQLGKDGTIDVMEHYRKKGFVPPEVYEDPTIADKLVFEEEVRVRHDIIRPSDFSFSETVAGSCVGLEEALGR